MIFFAYSRQQNEIETCSVDSILFVVMAAGTIAATSLLLFLFQKMKAREERGRRRPIILQNLNYVNYTDDNANRNRVV